MEQKLKTETIKQDLREHRGSFLTIILAAVPVCFSSCMSWFGVFTFINAYYTKGLGRSNEDWTALTLWYTGSMTIWPILCVWLAKRMGHRRSIIIGMFAAGVLYLAVGLIRSDIILGIMIALMAFVPSVLTVSWMPMVIHAGADKPGRALAIYAFVNTSVGAAALISGGRLLTVLGYIPAFEIVGVACLICTAVFVIISKSMAVPQSKKQTSLFSIHKSDFMKLATGPFLFIVFAGVFMEPFNFHTANQLFPNISRDVHGLSEGTISTIIALGRLPALLSLVFLSRIVDRVRVTTWYGIGLMVAGICIGGIGSAGSTHVLIMCYFGYYLFHGMVWGTDSAAINMAAEPDVREYAFAVMSIASTLSCITAGILHNRMLNAGFQLQSIFHTCGFVGAAAGFTMICYSYSKYGRWSDPRLRRE